MKEKAKICPNVPTSVNPTVTGVGVGQCATLAEYRLAVTQHTSRFCFKIKICTNYVELHHITLQITFF